ncbi:MAG TPA: 2-phospho-L-lactate guanylyltransferase, partial [Marmoricola sp.]|nr:2-phospho-L-lactate guanylyltransferase [Marmoricola sp.]
MSEKFALLVPVKTLSRAKSRLVGTDAETRVALMRAFAMDAIAAAAQSAHVRTVRVVTDEAGFEASGVEVLPDEGDGDLNAALRHAAVRVRLADPGTSVAAMCADLPSLRTADLDAALTAGMSPRWFVADASGTGTTLLAAGPGVDLDPHFGADSARRHEESGAVAVRADVPSLRLDVDTDADLARARQTGVGQHTWAEMQKRG